MNTEIESNNEERMVIDDEPPLGNLRRSSRIYSKFLCLVFGWAKDAVCYASGEAEGMSYRMVGRPASVCRHSWLSLGWNTIWKGDSGRSWGNRQFFRVMDCNDCWKSKKSTNEGSSMNTNDADKNQGLYNKFTVSRTDGTDLPGEKHEWCKYFVLDLTHDPHAIAAIRAYADSCRVNFPALAKDIYDLIDLMAIPKWICQFLMTLILRERVFLSTRNHTSHW